MIRLKEKQNIPSGWQKPEMQEKIQCALNCLIKYDYALLHSGVNERTLTHLLALYLMKEFPDHHVDCEYNRMWRDGEEMTKEIVLPEDMFEHVSVYETEATTVFPDIIIHRREDAEHNLLVIEAKKSSNKNRRTDFSKLNGFMRDQNNGGRSYKFSAFIIFDVENPNSSTIEVKENGENWKL